MKWASRQGVTPVAMAQTILEWAERGRRRGNTLAVVGPGGTGKSWGCLDPLKEIIRGSFFEVPSDGSYPLERLALKPTVIAFLLDELDTGALKELFGGKPGWWKR